MVVFDFRVFDPCLVKGVCGCLTAGWGVRFWNSIGPWTQSILKPNLVTWGLKSQWEEEGRKEIWEI